MLFSIIFQHLPHELTSLEISQQPQPQSPGSAVVAGQGSKSQLNLRFIAITTLFADPFLDRLLMNSVYKLSILGSISHEESAFYGQKLVVDGELW